MAIAAVLALGTTPAAAQEAAPSLALPQAGASTTSAPPPVVTPPPVSSAPTIAQPGPATPTLSLPVDVPAAANANNDRLEGRQAASTAPVRRDATRSQNPQATPAVPAVATAASAAPAPASAPVAPSAAAAPASSPEAPVAAAVPPVPTSDTSRFGLAAAAAGLLAALGLGLAGFAAARSRRRKSAAMTDAAPDVTPIVTAPPVQPVRFPEGLRQTAERRAPAVPVVGQTAERFVIPAGPVPTGAARQDLVERMAAAAPDGENPFTSLKSRRKRARLILQAREAGLRADARKPFDWRTYRPSDHRTGIEQENPVTV